MGSSESSKLAATADECQVVNIHDYVTFNYFILPHVPKEQGTLLSPEGEPVWLRFDNVDWKGLADRLQGLLNKADLPRGIKVFVGNDAIDVYDINAYSIQDETVVNDYDPFNKASQLFSQVTLGNYRAGIIRLADHEKGLHLNPEEDGVRPAVAGVFIGIRYQTLLQFADYHHMVTELLLGCAHDSQPADPVTNALPRSVMPKPLREWLIKEVGVVYSDVCTTIVLPEVKGKAE